MNTFTQLDSIISDLQANGKEVTITKLPNSTRYKRSLYGVKKAKSIRQKISA